MRVVIDTNVLVSALHFRSDTSRLVLQRVLRGEDELVTSAILLDELVEILGEFGWEPYRVAAVRGEIERLSKLVEASEVPDLCRDPDDNEVLAAAASGGAAYITTGDKDLTSLGEHDGIVIVTPAAYAKIVSP